MERRKLDSRVRFQHAGFAKKLERARNYKRNSRPRPDNKLEIGLQKVGLSSLLAQLLCAAGIVIVAYLLYVPNPLFVKTVKIEGLADEYRGAAQESVKKYQDSRAWYVPANNILFFDYEGLASHLAQDLPAVSHIESAYRSFGSKTVTIQLVQKYERYLVVRPEDQLVLFNDGTVKGQMPELRGELPQSGRVMTVSVNHSGPVNGSQQYFSAQFIDLAEQSAALLPERTGQDFAYFKVKVPADDQSLNGEFIESWKKSGVEAVLSKKAVGGRNNPALLRIVLEPGSDIQTTADRLKLLLEQTTPERYRALDYVDLRLPNRAYLCLINTPCTNP